MEKNIGFSLWFHRDLNPLPSTWEVEALRFQRATCCRFWREAVNSNADAEVAQG